MLGQMKRIGELVSSNVEALIDRAENPRKMLKLMRSEIEHSVLQLTQARARAEADAKRLSAQAEAKADEAEEWTSKAKLAMDKGREDLARSALLAREEGREEARKLAADAEAKRGEVPEIDTAIADLEKRRAEVQAQIDAMPAPPAKSCATSAASPRPTLAEKHRGRIDAMEKRTGFAMEHSEANDTVDPAAIDAELEQMARDSAIEDELAAMRPAKAKPKARRKA